ncbi:hypothetical protein FB567DRAFT_217499 [Paraphoma chrysanthemicola]|uniref:Uncharacterized protein n=1 Tax=Paraphoma chrysanthemicola TaxID=798071 RepID=A0A8K0VSE9_9PLEO|nr:hypothetical protein FB567DRAFT_217499 [Paraphoma chrysanthemicola]
MSAASPSYVELLALDQKFKRSWVVDYLRTDLTATRRVKGILSPIQIGSFDDATTRVVLVDFYRAKDGTTKRELRSEPRTLDDIEDWLKASSPDVHIRLVLVSSTSGVTAQQRQWQLDRKGTSSSPDAPVLSTPRRPGGSHRHAIHGHDQVLPDPGAIRTVADALHPHPSMLLRFLDHDKHLTYQCQTWQVTRPGANSWTSANDCKYVHVGVDPTNRMIAMIDHDLSDDTRTILILASEDNLLGIDANPKTPAHLQPLRQVTETPSVAFANALEQLSQDECTAICSKPKSLLSLYSSGLVSAFAAHLELYQRYWAIKFEPFANTSAVYGCANHRDAARHFALELSTQLRYINHTINELQAVPDEENCLAGLLKDFEYFAQEVGALRQQCNQFLEQQVTKLALQDSREQMQEAHDMKRITYLAFIFAPLSLVSSFFGMNVKELDSGSAPVWQFAVTALAILATSLLIAWLAGSGAWEWLRKMFDIRRAILVNGFFNTFEDPNTTPEWMTRLPRVEAPVWLGESADEAGEELFGPPERGPNEEQHGRKA